MEHHEKAGCLFPKIGMRNVKTALAAALCALVYYFLDRNPTFACIGAISVWAAALCKAVSTAATASSAQW